MLALASLEVDMSGIEEGQTVTVKWRGKPVFIRYRTPEEIAEVCVEQRSGAGGAACSRGRALRAGGGGARGSALWVTLPYLDCGSVQPAMQHQRQPAPDQPSAPSGACHALRLNHRQPL